VVVVPRGPLGADRREWVKLWCGGGEVVNHSRPPASQGLSPAGTGLRQEIQRFTSRMAKLMPMTKAPIVEIWL